MFDPSLGMTDQHLSLKFIVQIQPAYGEICLTVPGITDEYLI